MSRVIHFELSMDNPERAIKFYSDVFGWDSEKWEGPMDYWMISTGKGEGIDYQEKVPNPPTLTPLTSLI